MDLKKFLLVVVAFVGLSLAASGLDSDPDVQRLRAAVAAAGFDPQSLEGLKASINGAWAYGRRGPAIEIEAKNFYKEGILKHNPTALAAADAVNPNLPLVDYAKALNATVLPSGIASPSATSSDEKETYRRLVRASDLDEDSKAYLISSIDFVFPGRDLLLRIKSFYLDGFIYNIPGYEQGGHIPYGSSSNAISAMRNVDTTLPLIEYVKALNVAAGFNPDGSAKTSAPTASAAK
jgi:hypothetical protein